MRLSGICLGINERWTGKGGIVKALEKGAFRPLVTLRPTHATGLFYEWDLRSDIRHLVASLRSTGKGFFLLHLAAI